MPQPAPGWYLDPVGSQRLRWQSGGERTEQFHGMPQRGAPATQQTPAGQMAGHYVPVQLQVPTVPSDPHNPSGVAPQLSVAEVGPQVGDAVPKSGRGWAIGTIVSVLLMVIFFDTMVYASIQLHTQDVERHDVQDQCSSTKINLDHKQDELDKVKKGLEEARK